MNLNNRHDTPSMKGMVYQKKEKTKVNKTGVKRIIGATVGLFALSHIIMDVEALLWFKSHEVKAVGGTKLVGDYPQRFERLMGTIGDLSYSGGTYINIALWLFVLFVAVEYLFRSAEKSGGRLRIIAYILTIGAVLVTGYNVQESFGLGVGGSIIYTMMFIPMWIIKNPVGAFLLVAFTVGQIFSGGREMTFAEKLKYDPYYRNRW